MFINPAALNSVVIRLISTIAVSIAALGMMVIVGWYTHNTTLVQILPQFAPMQYNTALCFALSGIGTLFLVKEFSYPRLLCGIFVAILSSLTLVQYLTNLDFGIDLAFFDPWTETRTTHLGRMAPNTALCFALSGLIIMAGSKVRSLAIGVSLTVSILALFSLLGYLIDTQSLYGLGSLTRMAIHTAIGFLLLSLSLAAYFYFKAIKGDFDIWRLAPSSIAIMFLTLSMFASYVVNEQSNARNKSYFNELVSDTQDSLLMRYKLYEIALQGAAGLFHASNQVSRDEWAAYATAINIDKNFPGINGIGYIDYVGQAGLEEYLKEVQSNEIADFKNHPNTTYSDKFIIKYIEPLDTNQKAVGLDIGFEENRREAAERALRTGNAALTRKITLVQDDTKSVGFLLLSPVYKSKNIPRTMEARKKAIMGWVYSPFIAPSFFEDINEINNEQLIVSVFDGKHITDDALIYKSASLQKDTESAGYRSNFFFEETTSVEVSGRAWTFVWKVSKNFEYPDEKKLGAYIILIGILFSFVLYTTLYRLIRIKDVVETQVRQRTKELRNANDELEEFAYRTSHDLRSPLISSISLLDLMRGFVEQDKKEEAQHSINLAQSSLKNLEKLVSDILALTMTQKKNELPEIVTFDTLISEAIDKLSHMDHFDKVRVIMSKIYSDPVKLDKARTTMIIENLIANAIKYHDPNEADPFIKITVERDANIIILDIEDNGLGIPEHQQEKMFGMFQRFHTQVSYGSGLGLYMIKKSAEVMGGRIIYKGLEAGSLFSVKLPLNVLE